MCCFNVYVAENLVSLLQEDLVEKSPKADQEADQDSCPLTIPNDSAEVALSD